MNILKSVLSLVKTTIYNVQIHLYLIKLIKYLENTQVVRLTVKCSKFVNFDLPCVGRRAASIDNCTLSIELVNLHHLANYFFSFF